MGKKNSFAKRLLKVWVSDVTDEDANSTLLDAFLEFGSETKDNIRCTENIEYGLCEKTRGGAQARGLKIKDTDIMISDIIWYLEDERVYEYLAKQFPDLNKDQIEGSLRMATMVLSAFEKEAEPEE